MSVSGMVLSLRNVSWIQGWWFEGVDVGLHSPGRVVSSFMPTWNHVN